MSVIALNYAVGITANVAPMSTVALDGGVDAALYCILASKVCDPVNPKKPLDHEKNVSID
jgi:hypothetical protein